MTDCNSECPLHAFCGLLYSDVPKGEKIYCPDGTEKRRETAT